MFARRIIATALALAFTIGSAVAAPVSFDQPSQPLGDALKQFARTAGVTLSVDSSLVAGKTAPALQQSLEPADALQELLKGSGLEAASSPSGGFIVKRGQRSGEADQQLPVVPVDAQAVSDPSVDPVHGYQARRSISATKTDTPLKDVPQSITVITKDAIEDQGMRSMGDVVRYVPGMNMAQGEGNRDQLFIRGQNTTADFFVDGVRDDVQYFRDFYNIERVEALKGPNAMIFGRGGGGGVINRVEKTAGWDSVRDVGVTFGSFETKRIAVDVGQGVNETAALRLNAMYEDSGSYRDHVDLERYGINPTMTLNLGPQTMLQIGYEYFHDERTADRGVPSFEGAPFVSDPGDFFGNPDLSVSDATNNVLNVLLEHKFDNELLLRNRTRYGEYEKFYQNVYPSGPVLGNGTFNIQAYNNATERENFFNQTDLTYVLQAAGMKHTLLGGIELGRQKTTNFRETGTFPGGTLTGTPAGSPTIFVPAVTFANNGGSDANNSGTTDVLGIYIQDQIELSQHWEVIAGVRFDQFSMDFHNNNTNQDFSRDDDLVSPRLGLIFKPIAPLSIYASYSVSYLPSSGDQFGSLTGVTELQEPEEFTNYEVGAKWDVNSNLSLTGAVFQLDRTNTVSPDPSGSGLLVQSGEQRSKGFELGLSGNVTSAWEVMAAYTYQDAKITSATGTTTIIPVGREVAGVPMHTISLWNKYQFTPTWGAGLGVIYQSELYASISNLVTVPDFTRVDAAIFYTLNKTFRVQLNVVNLLDEEHWTNAHNDNNITPGTTRGAFVTLNATF